MQIVQDGEWVKGARITGPTHHFLGLRFGAPAKGLKGKVAEAVLSGVAEANQELGTRYQVAEIMIDERDQYSARAYSEMADALVRHAASLGLRQAA